MAVFTARRRKAHKEDLDILMGLLMFIHRTELGRKHEQLNQAEGAWRKGDVRALHDHLTRGHDEYAYYPDLLQLVRGARDKADLLRGG
jgi:hypothetical protein